MEDSLTEREVEILAFERQWWKYLGAKEAAILNTFGVSANIYFLTVNGLIDRPAALAHDPMTVKRLRRLRATRRARRTG